MHYNFTSREIDNSGLNTKSNNSKNNQLTYTKINSKINLPVKDKILLNLRNYKGSKINNSEYQKGNENELNYNNNKANFKVENKNEKSHSVNKVNCDNKSVNINDYNHYQENNSNVYRSQSNIKIPRKNQNDFLKQNNTNIKNKEFSTCDKNRILDKYNNIHQSRIFENLNEKNLINTNKENLTINNNEEINFVNESSKNINLSDNIYKNEYVNEDNELKNNCDSNNSYNNMDAETNEFKVASYSNNLNASKENYFKINTNIQNNYSRDYVNELKSLFMKEKNELLFKNNLIQNTLDKLKNSFSEQIQQMTFQIEESEKKHEFSLKALEENIESYYKTIILEKDSLIEELNIKISNILDSNKNLTERLNVVEIAYEDKSNKISQMEFNFNDQLENKKMEIFKLENLIKEKEAFYNDRIKAEKNYVLDEYEKKLNDLCLTFENEKNESRKIIQNLYEENQQLKESLSQIDNSYINKIQELSEEIICHKQNLVVYRERRLELENEKNNLRELLDNSKKEIKLITSEMRILEENNLALIKDNDDLNIQLGKLGKIVYGKTKNQKIKN